MAPLSTTRWRLRLRFPDGFKLRMKMLYILFHKIVPFNEARFLLLFFFKVIESAYITLFVLLLTVRNSSDRVSM